MSAAQPSEKHTIDRAELAKMVMTLFAHWQLSTEEQLALLGLSIANRAALARYRKGLPLAQSRDLLDRVGILLGIHYAQGDEICNVGIIKPPVDFCYQMWLSLIGPVAQVTQLLPIPAPCKSQPHLCTKVSFSP